MASAAAALIQEIYGAFARRDVAAVFRLFSDDIEIVQSTAVPWGGAYRGHDGARAFFGTLTAHINSTVTVERVIDAGERVVVTGRTRGTVNATGTAYDVPFAHVWAVENGTAVRAEFYIDNPKMLAALKSAR